MSLMTPQELYDQMETTYIIIWNQLYQRIEASPQYVPGTTPELLTDTSGRCILLDALVAMANLRAVVVKDEQIKG